MPIATERIGPAPLVGAAEQYRVPMRDGVAQAADVCLPTSSDRRRTVLFRPPYDQHGRYRFMEQIADGDFPHCLWHSGTQALYADGHLTGHARSAVLGSEE
ncbi:hypothetical protein JHN63_08705 [Streptomyces sp. MBT65]|uniref:hypothetical protein n=1 Tax=Streptomyces sp. MBT65 TaxID=1488395 RepID=UPI001909DFDE|nr:hypothetical protein [Streptomyces sp. MBT65]MBK3573897.1 hypothetical protein [Streptomyces sp. MBT65]